MTSVDEDGIMSVGFVELLQITCIQHDFFGQKCCIRTRSSAARLTVRLLVALVAEWLSEQYKTCTEGVL